MITYHEVLWVGSGDLQPTMEKIHDGYHTISHMDFPVGKTIS